MSPQDPCLIYLSQTNGRWGSLYFCNFPLLVWGFGCLWWVGSEFLGVSIAGEKFPAGQSSFLSEFILAAEVSRTLPSPLSALIRSSVRKCLQWLGLLPGDSAPWACVLPCPQHSELGFYVDIPHYACCLARFLFPESDHPHPPPTHSFLFICLWSFQLKFLKELKACAWLVIIKNANLKFPFEQEKEPKG